MNKKAQSPTNFLNVLAIGIVVAGVLTTVGAYVVAQVQSKMTAGTAAHQAAGNATLALRDMAEWFPIVAIVGVAGVILGFVVLYIAGRQ